MYNIKVINRKGDTEEISFDKINNRLKSLINYISDDISVELKYINVSQITLDTISKVYDGITTTQLDIESAKVCASMELIHHNYSLLGGRILASNLYKNLKVLNLEIFSSKVLYLNNKLPNFYNKNFIKFIIDNKNILDNIIKLDRNYLITYFGFKTLEKSYLFKYDDITIETPQDMFLRVAINIHYREIDIIDNIFNKIKLTYDNMSLGYFIHATPTLFNSGTHYEQLSSCFLLGTEDSLSGIYKTLYDVAQISKWAGGIGLHISNIRAKGALIHSTNGKTDGIIPMLKVYNETARFVSQGGKRKGSIAIYLEPWHADIESFLDIKKNTGAETERARDLFTALWIPDEFMNRVLNDENWYLMCPSICPNLNEVYDEEFNILYNKYIKENKFIKIIKARDLFNKIMESQVETGVPYILFKDNINRKSNQSNIGIIKSSNLCAEITEVSGVDEYSVCNLGSIAVNKFIKQEKLKLFQSKFKEDCNSDELMKLYIEVYDFDKLAFITKLLTNNLNNIIDYNYYPVEETSKSNLKHRPIGIGIQGLGDLYNILDISYSSYAAKYLDAIITETIYYYSIDTSSNIANIKGSYSSYIDSAFYNSKFQFDLCEDEYNNNKSTFNYKIYPQRLNWNELKNKVKLTGIRNSLLTALMPTAGTSQILGNSECFEIYTSNIYKRTTLAGEFQVINQHLVDKLIELNIWNDDIRNFIIKNDGSIQNLNISIDINILNNIKNVYKTIWELKQKDIIDHALARSPYIDQSQSMNLFFANPNFQYLYSALIYGWKNGLKTGCYYLRSKPASEAIKTSIVCSDEVCTICSA
jgi:ribonucleoside-diphosphate reductase alpha chain